MRFYLFCALSLVLVGACALAGCGPMPIQKVVSVPTPVACVKAADVPAEPPKIAGKLTGNAAADIPVVTVLALQLRDWGEREQALLTGCE